MDVQESQSNWPEMRKTLEKPGFCSTGFRKLTERTGTEQLSVFPVFLRGSRGAENDSLDLSITGNTLETSTAT
jgi:hypothetical protein